MAHEGSCCKVVSDSYLQWINIKLVLFRLLLSPGQSLVTPDHNSTGHNPADKLGMTNKNSFNAFLQL